MADMRHGEGLMAYINRNKPMIYKQLSEVELYTKMLELLGDNYSVRFIAKSLLDEESRLIVRRRVNKGLVVPGADSLYK